MPDERREGDGRREGDFRPVNLDPVTLEDVRVLRVRSHDILGTLTALKLKVEFMEKNMEKVQTESALNSRAISRISGALALAAFMIPIVTAALTALAVKFIH